MKCRDCGYATYKRFGVYCEVLGLPMNQDNIHLCKITPCVRCKDHEAVTADGLCEFCAEAKENGI